MIKGLIFIASYLGLFLSRSEPNTYPAILTEYLFSIEVFDKFSLDLSYGFQKNHNLMKYKSLVDSYSITHCFVVVNV